MDVFSSAFMEHVVTVKSPTVTRDAGGGVTTAWSTTRQAAVACSILAPFDSARRQEGAEPLVGTYTVATFYTGAQRGDLLTVTTGPSLVNVNLRVTGIKSQPGIEAIGFTETLVHIQAERVW